MIVFGGSGEGGGRFNPLQNAWSTLSTEHPGPSARTGHSGVWTGHELLVWGGTEGFALPRTGGRYDPATGSWVPMASGSGCPSGRFDHTAIWTGREMVVWGGHTSPRSGGEQTGGRYDPLADAWAPTSIGPGCPQPRFGHGTVWTGSRMLVWGGASVPGNCLFPQRTTIGGSYDPATDTWQALSSAGAPLEREYHSAVWTGREMVVWGGEQRDFCVGYGQLLATGGRYDPATDSWRPTSTSGSPPARTLATAVWSGSEMIVWGGTTGRGGGFRTGGRYDPVLDRWLPTSTAAGCPSARWMHTAVWDGAAMVVWGGYPGGGWMYLTDTGGRYDPLQDRWSRTSISLHCPAGRGGHSATWSGRSLLVWGGTTSSGPTSSGGMLHRVPCGQ